MDTLQSQMDNILSNPVTYGVLAIFLGMYGPRLHPRLPKPVKDLFGVPLFRFAVIVLVIFMSTKDLSMALVVSIAFLIVMSIANSQDMEEEFMSRYKEGYSNFDAIKEFYDDEETEFFQEGPETYDNKDEGEEDFDQLAESIFGESMLDKLFGLKRVDYGDIDPALYYVMYENNLDL